MNKLTKSILGSTTLAGLATLAPLSFNADATAPVRINQASCQSSTCELGHPNLVCITSWGYITNAKCYTGCS